MPTFRRIFGKKPRNLDIPQALSEVFFIGEAYTLSGITYRASPSLKRCCSMKQRMADCEIYWLTEAS